MKKASLSRLSRLSLGILLIHVVVAVRPLSASADVAIIGGPVTNSANGHVYYLLEPSNWTDAEAKAVQLGGHLVTINDAAENEWVYTNFRSYGGSSSHLWIGLSDQDQEGTFVWASDEPVTYTDWYPGEPNAIMEGEDYVHINSPVYETQSKWNDHINDPTDGSGHPFRGVVEVVPDTTTNCLGVPSGLVAWWQAEGNGADGVGSNPGAVQSGVGFVPGKVGQGFLLNNTNAFIRVPASPSLNVGAASGFTLEAWICPSNASGGYHPIFEWNSGIRTDDSIGVHLWIHPSGTLSANLVETNGTPHGISTPSETVVENTFQHVALTYDRASGLAQIFLNGDQKAQINMGNVTLQTTYDLWVGRRPIDLPEDITYGSYFDGIVDEVSLYNRALLSTEIQDIFEAGEAGKCLSAPVGPSIIDQPTNVTVLIGETATFSVVASGTPPLSYQWMSNNAAIVGAMSDTLTLNNVQLADIGIYSVVVTNLLGSTTSSNATLTVLQSNCYSVSNGLVAWWPGEGDAADVIGGNNGTLVGSPGFSTGAVGQSFLLQGATNYIRVPGNSALNVGVGAGMTIEAWINPESVAEQKPIVEWNNGSTWGVHFLISQSTLGGFGTGPGCLFVNLTDTSGGNHFFASPAGIVQTNVFQHVAMTYDRVSGQAVIYRNGVIAAQKNLGINFTPQTTYDLYFGRRANAPLGTETWTGKLDEVSLYSRALSSNEVMGIFEAGAGGKCLSAPVGPSILNQPTNVTVLIGETATFNVVASGTPPLSYQWWFNGTNLLNSTNAGLDLINVQPDQAGEYSVTVTNQTGTATSDEVILTVMSPPVLSANVPVIHDFSPLIGTVGTEVSIKGTNFSPVMGSNIVYFGAVRAAFISASETNLVVTVTVGATYAPITVTVNGLTAYSREAFLPSFAGDGSAISALSFAPRQDLVSGDGPTRTVIADLDADGKPDLAVGNVYANTISLFRSVAAVGSLSSTSFESRVDLPSIGGGLDNPYSVIAADVDGDGRLDLLFTDRSGNRVGVHRNLSAPGSLNVGSFSAPVYFSVGTDPRHVRVADLDGDGRVEIVTANTGAGTISILPNKGVVGSLTTNSFASRIDLAAGAGAYDVGIADLDGDGKPDLAVVNNSAPFLSVFRNISVSGQLGASSFATKVDLSAPVGSETILLRDVDGDGRPDIVAGSPSSKSIHVYRNISVAGSLSVSSFESRVNFPVGNRVHNLAMGDLNGDGRSDVAVVGEIASYLSVFENLSSPGEFNSSSFGQRVDLGAGWNAWGVSIGDLDGDGRPDIVFCNAYDDTITMYRNQTGFGGSPIIVSHPTNQTMVAGSDVSFSVVASGTTGLAYQWWHGENEILGAINPTLTLTNVQSGDEGIYFAVVTNSFGSATSSNAVLTVLPGPAIVRVVNTTNMSGTPVTVPVVLVANGDESALSFSLEFDSQRLTYASVDLGSGGAGAALLPNAGQAANGRLGVTMAMSSGTFAPGVQEVVVVTFNTSPLLSDTPLVSPVIFTDTPLPRQLSDESPQPLPVTFANGSVTLLPSSLEADTAPRPNGNRSLDIFDWVQVGRFVAGLDIPSTASEFQRADCAPRSTFGDGQLKVTDWVQAGRYAALLDPITVAGGPSSPVVPMALMGKMDLGGGREVRVAGGQAIESVATMLPVTIEAQGDEHALGFSLVFDAEKFTYSGLIKGTAATAATLNINTNQAADGRVGVALALTAGNSFPAGTRELVRVSLKPKAGAAGSNTVQFADLPVVRSISDSAANELTAGFATSALLVNPLPTLEISSSEDSVVVTWPAWALGFELQTCGNDSLAEGGWTNYPGTIDGNDEKISVIIPITDEPAYFRLRHP